MTRKDLKSGMMVELRNGQRYVVLLNTKAGDLLIQLTPEKTNDSVLILYHYCDDLTPNFPYDKPDNNDQDIIKVFNFDYNKTNNALNFPKYILIWERPQVVGFDEAYKAYRDKNVIQSVSSEHQYSVLYNKGTSLRNVTNKEIDSDWIILRGSETSD